MTDRIAGVSYYPVPGANNTDAHVHCRIDLAGLDGVDMCRVTAWGSVRQTVDGFPDLSVQFPVCYAHYVRLMDMQGKPYMPAQGTEQAKRQGEYELPDIDFDTPEFTVANADCYRCNGTHEALRFVRVPAPKPVITPSGLWMTVTHHAICPTTSEEVFAGRPQRHGDF